MLYVGHRTTSSRVIICRSRHVSCILSWLPRDVTRCATGHSLKSSPTYSTIASTDIALESEYTVGTNKRTQVFGPRTRVLPKDRTTLACLIHVPSHSMVPCRRLPEALPFQPLHKLSTPALNLPVPTVCHPERTNQSKCPSHTNRRYPSEIRRRDSFNPK